MTPKTCNSPDTEAQAVNFISHDPLVAAMVTLANKGIPTDIQALLINGDPMRGIAPNSLAAALKASAPALPQDVAKLIVEYRPSMPTEVLHLWAEDAKAALTAQSSTIASAREVIEQLLPAAEKVLEGLHARIDAADNSAVPVFYGISDLSDAINAARDWKGR